MFTRDLKQGKTMVAKVIRELKSLSRLKRFRELAPIRAFVKEDNNVLLFPMSFDAHSDKNRRSTLWMASKMSTSVLSAGRSSGIQSSSWSVVITAARDVSPNY